MKANYKILLRILMLACTLLSSLSLYIKAEPARSILIGVTLALLVAIIVQLILYKVKPALFKDK